MIRAGVGDGRFRNIDRPDSPSRSLNSETRTFPRRETTTRRYSASAIVVFILPAEMLRLPVVWAIRSVFADGTAGGKKAGAGSVGYELNCPHEFQSVTRTVPVVVVLRPSLS